MVGLVFDADMTDVVLAGLLRAYPEVDVLSVRDVGLGKALDDLILEWAASVGRMVVSHDVSTMTDAAYERLRTGKSMRGLIVVPQSLPFRKAIDDLAVIAVCSEPDEHHGQVLYLPSH